MIGPMCHRVTVTPNIGRCVTGGDSYSETSKTGRGDTSSANTKCHPSDLHKVRFTPPGVTLLPELSLTRASAHTRMAPARPDFGKTRHNCHPQPIEAQR